MKKLLGILLICLGCAAQAQTPLYVWAANGSNLRQAPSSTAPVVKKLVYGTAVETLSQDGAPVADKMTFFAARHNITSLTQMSAKSPQVVLNGRWLKVAAGGQQGYAFDSLLLAYPPLKEKEEPTAWLIRAFSLKAGKAVTRREKSEDAGMTNVLTTRPYASADGNIVLKVESNRGDAGVYGDGGAIRIRRIGFDQAFVLFNALFPPLSANGYQYQPGQRFSYLLDEVGNSAELKKAGDGVEFSWFYGLN